LKISVVILNYNVRYFLEQCILSVQLGLKHIDGEIIVIDNNSEDDSCAMVKLLFPEITLIQNKENVGFSKANNQAVKVAKGEYLCILNPDTAIEESTFEKCLAYAETIDNMGALGVHLIDGTGNFLPESKRNIPTPKVSLFKLVGFDEKYYASHISEKDKGSIDVLVGAFMFLKRTVYNEVGGFDEDYFMYGEDIDLSYKILKAGYQNQYLGAVSTLHYKGESTLKNRDYFDRFYGAMRIFYKKHFSQNLFLSFSVSAAVAFAKMIQMSKGTGKGVATIKIQKAYVFTEDITLSRKLSEKMEIELSTASKSLFDDDALRNCLFIFDVGYIPYSQIFSIMAKFKNKNNQFRICPPRSNFVIGSDKSDEKGSVVLF
jgi:GT2 family glycosyltransferase|tara:strand:- start:244 stop:1365 length:1122 start_codon:yes stop_codon:yes gene_type:complete